MFGAVSRARFLREYWQKNPLLVRGAFPNWKDPVSPDELAGLSGDQENALLAIEMAMSEMKAHGDEMSQWRLAQIERAIEQR